MPVDVVLRDQAEQDGSFSGNSERICEVSKRTWKPINHNDMKFSRFPD